MQRIIYGRLDPQRMNIGKVNTVQPTSQDVQRKAIQGHLQAELEAAPRCLSEWVREM